MSISVEFDGLLSTTTAAHVHCCTAVAGAGMVPVATITPSIPGFPESVSSGSCSMVFDTLLASTYRTGFITASPGTPGTAEAALLSSLRAGRACFSVHRQMFSGREIRDFLAPAPQALPIAALLPVVLPLLRCCNAA